MSKFYYFAVIITGLIVLMNLGGIQTPLTGSILSAMNVNLTSNMESVSNIQSSILWKSGSSNPANYGIIEILLGLSAIGALISFFGRSPDVSYLLGAIVAAFSTYLIVDMINLANILLKLDEAWIKAFALVIFVPLFVGYLVTVISFWRGND